MGKRNSRRKNLSLLDESDDDDSLSSTSTSRSEIGLVQSMEGLDIESPSLLDQCLDALSEKRAATREKALSSIIDSFRGSVQYEFVRNKFVTLLHMCVTSVKRGSSREVSLASHMIGLLALTVGEGDKGHEIYEEVFPVFSQALKSSNDSSKTASIVEALAIVTFVESGNDEERDVSAEIIWELLHPKRGSNVVPVKQLSGLISKVVSSWAFILASAGGRNININININTETWLESISHLSTLLEKDDRSVRMVSGEALALIFEIGGAKEFSETDGSTLRTHILGMKSKVVCRARDLAGEAGGKGSNKKDLNTQRNLFRDVLGFFERGDGPETSMRIGNETLSCGTWAGLVRLNFLKHFLGGGFSKHVQENGFVRDVFGIQPRGVTCCGSGEQAVTAKEKKGWSANSSKRRTQILNKKRMVAWGMNSGHYTAFADGLDD